MIFYCSLSSVSIERSCTILCLVPSLNLKGFKLKQKSRPKRFWPSETAVNHKIRVEMSNSQTCRVVDIMTGEMRNYVFVEWAVLSNFKLIVFNMPESRSLSELTRQIAPPTKNGHALPPEPKSFGFPETARQVVENAVWSLAGIVYSRN